MLEKTTGISPDATLASEPQAWAKGKTWYAGTSFPTPQYGDAHGASAVYVVQDSDDIEETISFSVTTENEDVDDVPLYSPGKFSFLLGGVETTSPLPFCATVDCFGHRLEYRSKQGQDLVFNSTSSTLARSFQTAFTTSASQLPVTMVAASSSAAYGPVAGSRPTSLAASQCFDLATWVSSAPDGAAWSDGAKLRSGVYEQGAPFNESDVDELTENSVMSLVDGGFTDSTGVAWSVAAGNTDLTILLNGAWPLSFYQLFSGADRGRPPMTFVGNKIFTMSEQEAIAEYDNFNQLILPEGNNYKYLLGIVYGTIKTTTQENRWFGISGGTPVNLNVVKFNITDVADAVTTNYFVYADLVAEIVDTVTSRANKAAVTGTLGNFFGV